VHAQAGFEGFVMEELKLKVPHLKSANVYEIAGSAAVLTITLGKGQDRGEAWDALRAAASARNMPLFKFIIAVDDDIDAPTSKACSGLSFFAFNRTETFKSSEAETRTSTLPGRPSTQASPSGRIPMGWAVRSC
jgi:hypothetical protein